MASFTRKAIMDSCVRLLEERPVDKITVKDIVEDCGINRNTFYYHFEDLPTLISEIVREDTQRVVDENISVNSLWECLKSAIDYTQKRRRMVMHIYHSANRAAFEQQLFKICEHVVTQYVDKAISALSGAGVTPEDRKIIIQAYACEFFGQIILWMSEDMPEDFSGRMLRLCELREGMTMEMLLRSKTLS